MASKHISGFGIAAGRGHMAAGGLPSLSSMQSQDAADWRSVGQDHNGGYLSGSTGGRTDNMPINVPAGSHVIPADVVSGLGEGNSLAGAAVLDRMLHTGPHGMRLDSPHGGGHGIPHAPTPAAGEYAKGGASKGNGRVPIVAASGEFVVHPSAVQHLGGGDQEKGHKVLNGFIKHVREKTAKKMMSLPGPK